MQIMMITMIKRRMKTIPSPSSAAYSGGMRRNLSKLLMVPSEYVVLSEDGAVD